MPDEEELYNSLIANAVLANSNDAYLLFRADDSKSPLLLSVSPSFETVTGLKAVNIVNSHTSFLAGTGVSDVDIDRVAKAVESQKMTRLQMPLSRRGGDLFPGEVTVIPIDSDVVDKLSGTSEKTPDGNHYVIICIRDISGLSEDDETLTTALERANDAQKVRDKFLSGMSHEFRTPMSGVLGMSELLSGTDLDSEQREYMDSIIWSAKSLVNILGDVIEFSKAESGEITLEHKPFNLPDALHHLKKTFDHREEKKNLDFQLTQSDGLPVMVKGDKGRFIQVLMQLAGNAFKFTDEGYVHIRAEPGEHENGRIWILITIKDSGIGIPENHSDSIFDSFSKASKSTMGRYGGTGLGLFIVKRLINLMDGRVQVESTENSGSLFMVHIPFETIELPKRGDAGGTEGGESEWAMPDAGDRESGELERVNIDTFSGKSILVVDDHPINRRLMEGMLKRAGLRVVSTDSGEKAVEVVAEQEIDLVLMDVHMPGMNGLEATKKIRAEQDERKKHVPVIAVSASVMEQDVIACLDSGMTGFISKPFSYDQLIRTIDEQLSGNRRTGQSGTVKSAETPADFSALIEMTAGDEQMMLEMIDLFLEQTPVLVENIRQSWEKGSHVEMGKAAHTLKPTFSYLGINYALPLILLLEEFKNPDHDAGDTVVVEQAIEELEQIAEAAYAFIHREALELRKKLSSSST